MDVIILGIAWIIIPLEFEYISEDGSFMFKSWNLFVLVCGLPSVILGLWLFFFPESPKFLFECGDAEEALIVLKNIYASNTGDKASNFPVSNTKNM